MNHKQILLHLAAPQLADAMAYDISRLANWGMLGPKPVSHKDVQRAVLSKLFRRWNCVFDASKDEVTENYRDIAWITAAVTLHRYGFSDDECTARAIRSIDKLNEEVALSDYFFRHSEEAKSLLKSPTVPLTKRPSVPRDVTFWRARDTVSYRLDRWYYALYVHCIDVGNAVPQVEFFNLKLDRPPTATDLIGLPAVGGKYNDGIRRIETYWVHGMRNNPDMANQFKLIQEGWNSPPSQQHLAQPVGGGSVIDVFRLQDAVDRSF